MGDETRSIATARRDFAELTGFMPEESSFYDRFNEGLVALLKELFDRALQATTRQQREVLAAGTASLVRVQRGLTNWALRGFDDIRVYIVTPELRIRWRGGRGGLDLRAHTPDRGEETLVVRLHGLAEVHPAPEATPTRPGLSRPSRDPQRPGAWLGEILPAVLADLGLSD